MKDESIRPWGHYEVLHDGEDCKVKRIIVKPGQRLSLQSHQRRGERWTIVSGRAEVSLYCPRREDGEIIFSGSTSSYFPGQTIIIPKQWKHRIANEMDEPLIFIEVQLGTYFGEDDIERFEDDYGR